MYASNCIAYQKAEISVRECDDAHTLRIVTGPCEVSITMSTEQLLELAETIEWYLLKKDEPANCFSCRNFEREVTPTDRGNQPGYHCKLDNSAEECKEWTE